MIELSLDNLDIFRLRTIELEQNESSEVRYLALHLLDRHHRIGSMVHEL